MSITRLIKWVGLWLTYIVLIYVLTQSELDARHNGK
jgi:hypothetical protein